MLISLNLGKLLESPDVDEKELGLGLCLFLLRHDDKTLICDFLTNDQVIARDIVTKRQMSMFYDCIQEMDINNSLEKTLNKKLMVVKKKDDEEKKLEEEIAKMIKR